MTALGVTNQVSSGARSCGIKTAEKYWGSTPAEANASPSMGVAFLFTICGASISIVDLPTQRKTTARKLPPPQLRLTLRAYHQPSSDMPVAPSSRYEAERAAESVLCSSTSSCR